jgi:hypothetical protein
MKVKLWRAKLLCSDCKAVLNTAEDVPGDQRGHVAVSSALMAGKCPNGCRSTFSDCNINTELIWEEQ